MPSLRAVPDPPGGEPDPNDSPAIRLLGAEVEPLELLDPPGDEDDPWDEDEDDDPVEL